MFKTLTTKLNGILLLLIVLFASLSLPEYVFAGPPVMNLGVNNSITDSENSRLIGYWDLRERQTYFQVTNTTQDPVRVHIQIYNAASGCAEFDYYDTFTPRDTHIYNVSNLDRNNGAELSEPNLSDGHGIIAITHVNPDDSFNEEPVLTGNFRILDSSGYEYRTNLAGPREYLENPGYLDARLNFNNIDGPNFADIVVIALAYNTVPGGVEPLTQAYYVTLFDENENPISCPPVVLGCFSDLPLIAFTQSIPDESLINVGVNQAITNSKGGPSLCLGSNVVGSLKIESSDLVSAVGYFVFVGLNNGNSTGSMDSAINSGEYEYK